MGGAVAALQFFCCGTCWVESLLRARKQQCRLLWMLTFCFLWSNVEENWLGAAGRTSNIAWIILPRGEEHWQDGGELSACEQMMALSCKDWAAESYGGCKGTIGPASPGAMLCLSHWALLPHELFHGSWGALWNWFLYKKLGLSN